MIRSPLTYPGAKGRAIEHIIPFIPKFKEYRETFLGGGSVYLHVRQMYGKDKIYWINDLYKQLYNFWIHTQKDSELVIKNILTWKNEFQGEKSGKFSEKAENLESAIRAYRQINFAALNDRVSCCFQISLEAHCLQSYNALNQQYSRFYNQAKRQRSTI